jgi:integrase
MPRKATGEVIERPGKRGVAFSLRFRAYGKRRYVTVGNSADGWTRQRAELELANVLADVRRGIWQPPTTTPVVEAPKDPTFHEFASEWFNAKQAELRPNTRTAYSNELTTHLLPFFARHRLSQITAQEVDRYRQAELRESDARRQAIEQGRPLTDDEGRVLRPFGATMINKTITRLGQILEDAVEYGLIDRNPAKGKRRRLKAPKNTRTHLDRVDQIVALINAAGELDGDQHRSRPDRRHIPRRTIVATLVFGGLRIDELCGLRWRDVDLVAGRIRVGEAKTDAGVRVVDMLPVLRDEILTWKARAPRTKPADYVFATGTGGRPSKDNLRSRIVHVAIDRANERLDAAGQAPLPPGLTPHGLRHTYASILIALGKNPRYVMAQIGHTDPAFTLRLYTHEMERRDNEQQRLQQLVEGADVSPAQASPAPQARPKILESP